MMKEDHNEHDHDAEKSITEIVEVMTVDPHLRRLIC
jgi:hypothetical protein